ncbi:FKBP-type peptidyl-prolyl cis-trans isomerase [Algibacter agarivorans]|uniref:Peptidyl-prolyl cis-trans isomerase n=2 Tax=Algibacter agarivorans TaxID=1109741 RepID=A0ABP9GFA7_9FLAO
MKIMKFLSLVALALVVVSCNNNEVSNKPLKTEVDSVSYGIGLNMGKQLKTGFDEANIEIYIQGLRNALDSTNILLDEQQTQKVIQTYFQKKQKEQAAIAKEEGEKAKADGIKFLEDNKSKEGVKITESGLQYIVLKEGSGDKPTTASKVKVHYHGTLIDGTVFDSSVDRGEPTEFGVTQVIKGWTEGLQLMTPGSKYKFFIPSDLAYGANPRPGGVIKPNSTLIFDVELLEVK